MSGQVINFTYKVDEGDLSKITQKLNDLAGDKAKTYMARALNKTATSARVKLAGKAQESYTVKTGGFKKDMQINNASAGNLVAVIHSDGNTLDVKKFHYSTPKSGVKIDVVRSGLKHIRKYGNMAFIGKGKANNQVYVRRGSSRLPIEKIKSKSVPYMIGSENRVWGPMRPQIGADLQKYMNQQIALLMR